MRDEIIEIFLDTIEPEEELNLSDGVTLKELGVDSLALLEVVTTIELKYDIEIPDEALKAIKTVGDAVACVEGLVK